MVSEFQTQQCTTITLDTKVHKQMKKWIEYKTEKKEDDDDEGRVGDGGKQIHSRTTTNNPRHMTQSNHSNHNTKATTTNQTHTKLASPAWSRDAASC
jgi:hypothetical protein